MPIVGSLFDVMRNLSKAGDEAYFHQLLLKYGPVAKVTVMGESAEIFINMSLDHISFGASCYFRGQVLVLL